MEGLMARRRRTREEIEQERLEREIKLFEVRARWLLLIGMLHVVLFGLDLLLFQLEMQTALPALSRLVKKLRR
jgi:hypothetical protein